MELRAVIPWAIQVDIDWHLTKSQQSVGLEDTVLPFSSTDRHQLMGIFSTHLQRLHLSIIQPPISSKDSGCSEENSRQQASPERWQF